MVWSLMHRDSQPKPQSTSKRPVVLADFANTTADPAFDGTLRRVMAGELEKSPYLSVLSDARMSETLRLMVRPSGTKFTPDVASEICERTASAAVVEGSVTSLGTEYVLGLRARNCRTGDVLDQEQASARKEEMFKELGQMANRFGIRAAESLPPVEKRPLLEIAPNRPPSTTSSSQSGGMPIPIFQSSRKLGLSPPDYSAWQLARDRIASRLSPVLKVAGHASDRWARPFYEQLVGDIISNL